MLIELHDASQSGEIRRLAAAYAQEIELAEADRGAVAIVATELATNLLKHARCGSILIMPIGHNGSGGLRITALDKGPGIGNLSEALEDGHSTVGTMGSGLGAIRRLSHNFEIYSAPSGTVIVTEFWRQGKAPSDDSPLRYGAVTLPIPGEQVNGDGWSVRRAGNCVLFMVVDGLGHGPHAAEAAREAESIVARISDFTPASILQETHDALRKTRGAAMSVSVLDLDKQLLHFAGMGNVAAYIVSPSSSRTMPSHNGTLGHQVHRIQQFTYPWNPDSILVMHSDGLNTRWNLNDYPGIWTKQPALIAGLLYRDAVRGRDDVTVLVAKNS
jgi:anti-sigma regulatory factor (Ser/Thr protein kinase)